MYVKIILSLFELLKEQSYKFKNHQVVISVPNENLLGPVSVFRQQILSL